MNIFNLFRRKKNVVGNFPDPEIPTLDDEGYMRPPWIKYPNIPKGSIGWRMGRGEDYIDEFLTYYRSRPRETRVAIMDKYKEPNEWSGFYKY